MSKQVVAVLFGGQSSEHDVSKVSAATIISNINTEKYSVIPVYITKEGKWLLYDGPLDSIGNNDWQKFASTCILSPDTEHHGLLRIVGDKVKNIPVDVVIPVLHGANGEDGTVQGLFELAKIPYVGCGVLSSAVSMNKAYTKIIVDTIGVDQAKYTIVYRPELSEDLDKCLDRVEEKCGYPCFVKPACAGSSVGITKAHNRDELIDGLWTASEHDRTIVIQASAVGQIYAAAEFYDYDAKYNNAESKTVIPANISNEKAEEIRKKAIEIFKVLDGRGLSRVDFFLEEKTNRVIFNEINTLPGFTSISMYPMLFRAAGIDTEELVDKLIELALTRNEE